MNDLLSLPNEILLLICDIIQPADIVDFALCSRRTHQLSKPRLVEHQLLQDRYTVVLNYRTRDYLPQVLKDALEYPRIPYYIRSLRLGLFAYRWTEGLPNHYSDYFKEADYPRFNPGDVARFCDFGRASGLDSLTERADYFEDFEEEEEPYYAQEPPSPKSIKAEWHQCLKDGSEGIVAALLVSRLTNLERLEWIPMDGGVNHDPYWFFHNMCKKMSNVAGLDPFHNLKTVVLRRNEGATRNLDTYERSLRFFMNLPVKTVHAQMVDDAALHYELLSPRTSHVTRLSLFEGFLHDFSVERLIACSRALKAFALRWPDAWPEESGIIPIAQIQKSLETHHRDNLQELILRSAGLKGQINPGRWSHFSTLRFLTINLSLLFPDDKSEMIRCYFPDHNDAIFIAAYQQILPTSIEHIRLHETEGSASLSFYLRDVQRLVQHKHLIVPHLHRLDLHLFARADIGDYARYRFDSLAEQWALYDQLPQTTTPIYAPTSSDPSSLALTESVLQTSNVEIDDGEVLEREISPSQFIHPTFTAPEIKAAVDVLADVCQTDKLKLHLWHRLSEWYEEMKEFGRLEDDGFEVDA